MPANADPVIHDLYRRWLGFAESGRLPSVDEMDFETLFAENPGMILVRVERQPDSSLRFRYERAGFYARALGRPLEGYTVDELVPPQQMAHFEEVYTDIVNSSRPHYWMRMNTIIGDTLSTFERLLVPVSDDGTRVDAFIGVGVWLDQPS